MTQQVQFINGQWLAGEGLVFSSIDPAKNQQIWQGQAASEQQVDLAFQAARAAFDAWADLTFHQRAEYVRAFGLQLNEHKEALALCIAEETGKPLWETRTEVAAMIGKIDISIRAYQERTGEKQQPMPQGQSFLRHKPHR